MGKSSKRNYSRNRDRNSSNPHEESFLKQIESDTEIPEYVYEWYPLITEIETPNTIHSGLNYIEQIIKLYDFNNIEVPELLLNLENADFRKGIEHSQTIGRRVNRDPMSSVFLTTISYGVSDYYRKKLEKRLQSQRQ